jgi:HlyD family secretion protein
VYKSTGDYVNVGDGIASVAVQTVGDYDRDSSINTEVIVYMPLSDGKKISKGMEVQVNPSTVDKEKYGYIVGSVKSVSEYVVSEESMMNVLNNELLVESLATDEALIEIHVELLRDNDTISGYQWTTKNGAPMSIDVGTECSVRIEVDSSRPLEIVFPFMESILDGESES